MPSPRLIVFVAGLVVACAVIGSLVLWNWNDPPPSPMAVQNAASQAQRPTHGVPSLRAPDPVVPHPLAREALRSVGADNEANRLWKLAINDPALTASQRKNLIEDLNEDGFPDPHCLTIADLPLIESRLRLIEELAPQAMDRTNAAAFAEAYKDLVNMRASLTKPKQ